MPKVYLEDTIAAISTPIGEGGISVIRISGPDALDLAQQIFKSEAKSKVRDFVSHTIHRGRIINDQGHSMDQVLLAVFRAPHS